MNTYFPDYAKVSPFPSQATPHTNSALIQATTPSRPKHLSTRSITEVSNPGVPKAHKHHHPHLHHWDREDREKHPRASGSNLGLRPSAAESGSAREERSVTPESRDVSRRESVSGVSAVWDKSEGMSSSRGDRRVVKEGEVREERERGALRAAELRNALLGINTLSNDTTRRLDNSYYSVLEKLSVLQSTISSLKELAAMTKGLNVEFKDESEELVRDINTQLDGFKEFTEQEKRIADLQRRVKAGRERIKVFGERVDVVKDRVEGWEKAEGEWQNRTRKNLRILWVFISIAGAIVLVLVAFHYTPTSNPEPKGHNTTGLLHNTTGLLGKIPDFEVLKNETRHLKKEVEERLEHGSRFIGQPEDGPRLRVFDEL